MKLALTVWFLTALMFISPVAIRAQRLGFSIGMPASHPSAVGAPQMPPLPRQLPAPSPAGLASLKLTLKPLNLVSYHLSPPQIDFAPDPRRMSLPAVPLALDPTLASGSPQICVDASLTRVGR